MPQSKSKSTIQNPLVAECFVTSVTSQVNAYGQEHHSLILNPDNGFTIKNPTQEMYDALMSGARRVRLEIIEECPEQA